MGREEGGEWKRVCQGEEWQQAELRPVRMWHTWTKACPQTVRTRTQDILVQGLRGESMGKQGRHIHVFVCISETYCRGGLWREHGVGEVWEIRDGNPRQLLN